jgi:hypothetical protein
MPLTLSTLEALARTVLYEGYALYPYKRSAVKNTKPVLLGVVYPRDYADSHPPAASFMQTECLLRATTAAELEFTVRFLHLRLTRLLEPATDGKYRPVPQLRIGERVWMAGWQALEREISPGRLMLSELSGPGVACTVGFADQKGKRRLSETGHSPAHRGLEVCSVAGLRGVVEATCRPVEGHPEVFRLSVRIQNTTPVANAALLSRDAIYAQSFLSTHTMLRVRGGEFISVCDPGEAWQPLVAECQNLHTWPVLVGRDNAAMLSSPIVLYDHPQLAPQSHGDLFDGTEIEEALLLHAAVLTDEDKQEIAGGDETMQAMIERVARLTPDDIMKAHSVLREAEPIGRPRS